MASYGVARLLLGDLLDFQGSKGEWTDFKTLRRWSESPGGLEVRAPRNL